MSYNFLLEKAMEANENAKVYIQRKYTYFEFTALIVFFFLQGGTHLYSYSICQASESVKKVSLRIL